jgi:hypothetical protein
MIYQETKTGDTWYYKCEDMFGTLEIQSPEQLDKSILDTLTVKVMHMPSHQNTVGVLSYTLTRNNTWLSDES